MIRAEAYPWSPNGHPPRWIFVRRKQNTEKGDKPWSMLFFCSETVMLQLIRLTEMNLNIHDPHSKRYLPGRRRSIS